MLKHAVTVSLGDLTSIFTSIFKRPERCVSSCMCVSLYVCKPTENNKVRLVGQTRRTLLELDIAFKPESLGLSQDRIQIDVLFNRIG